MNKRVTIDPVTRIEGHLRVDVEVDGGRVKKAWASGQMWRGVENILIGRDPRDAWAITQRICGVCTTVHAIASVRAVENALQLEIPVNAQYIRNMIILAHAVHDHIVHFYHLSALDWVDVVSALKADPEKTASLAQSLSNWNGNSKAEFVKVQGRRKETCWPSRTTSRRWKSSATPARSSPCSAPSRRTSRTSRSAAWPIPWPPTRSRC